MLVCPALLAAAVDANSGGQLSGEQYDWPGAARENQLELGGGLGLIKYRDVVLGASRFECDQLPVIVAIHGLYETPESFLAYLPELAVPVRIILPAAPDGRSRRNSWYAWPDVLHLKQDTHYQAQRIAALLDELLGEERSNNRVLVTGFSQGGAMSFVLASQHTGRVSAMVTLAGASIETPPPAASLSYVPPIVSLHAVGDGSVTFKRGEATAKRFRAQGWQNLLIPFDWDYHDVSATMRKQWKYWLERYLLLTPAQDCR